MDLSEHWTKLPKQLPAVKWELLASEQGDSKCLRYCFSHQPLLWIRCIPVSLHQKKHQIIISQCCCRSFGNKNQCWSRAHRSPSVLVGKRSQHMLRPGGNWGHGETSQKCSSCLCSLLLPPVVLLFRDKKSQLKVTTTGSSDSQDSGCIADSVEKRYSSGNVLMCMQVTVIDQSYRTEIPRQAEQQISSKSIAVSLSRLMLGILWQRFAEHTPKSCELFSTTLCNRTDDSGHCCSERCGCSVLDRKKWFFLLFCFHAFFLVLLERQLCQSLGFLSWTNIKVGQNNRFVKQPVVDRSVSIQWCCQNGNTENLKLQVKSSSAQGTTTSD